MFSLSLPLSLLSVCLVSLSFLGGAPSGKLYLPKEMRSEVLQWGHASKLACHLRLPRTLHLLCQRFRWPSMVRDTRRFIAACTECARGKSSHQAPPRLLQPLQVPQRPWSHMALDFATGLTESRENMAILTVMDRFSRVAHFIPPWQRRGKLLV